MFYKLLFQLRSFNEQVKGGRRSANQLSPISVLEFPEEDSNSPSSSSGFPNACENRRPELVPVHLGQKLELSDDSDDLRRKRAQFEAVEEKAKELLELVKNALTGEYFSYVQTAEKVLLEFLREAVSSAVEEEETVKVAVEWVEGEGWWEAESLPAVVKEMEEDGRRQAAEEAEALAAAVEYGVFESLVEELVAGLRLR